LIANVNRKLPPLYMPSSGSIVSVKLRISSGFGKVVFIVLPSDNSLRSGEHLPSALAGDSKVMDLSNLAVRAVALL
jgi:hypothetical protein